MRRGEEEVTAFYPEAGACAKAVWWQVALQAWLRQEEERMRGAVFVSSP